MNIKHSLAGALAAMLVAAVSAPAQVVSWDSPLLLPPRAEAGFGVFLLDGHRSDIGVLGTWRMEGEQPRAGLRFGLVSRRREDGISALAGVDLTGPLTRATPDFPLDVSWVAGLGASAGPRFAVAVPAGLTVGYTFVADDVRFTPYATPRVVLDAGSHRRGGPQGGTESQTDLDFAVDLGIDLAFQRTWLIRFGATLGRDALAIGVEF